MGSQRKLKPEELRCNCDPDLFDFETTAEIEPLDEVIGQRRAVEAIDFGLNMEDSGYHIFVTGQPGTGKTTIVQNIVARYARDCATPHDWCMVNNFKDEYRPLAIAVPAGGGPLLSRRVAQLITSLRARLVKAFEDKEFQAKAEEIQQDFGEKKRILFDGLNQLAAQKKMAISKTQAGLFPVPLNGDKPFTPEEFQKLPEDRRQVIEKEIRGIKTEIENVLREVQKLNQAQQAEMEQVVEKMALFVARDRIDFVRESYTEWPQVLNFLEGLQTDIVENIDRFTGAAKSPSENPAEAMPNRGREAARYEVNVLIDRGGSKGAPVVFEPNPTYQNVFGRIEKRAYMGMLTTDYTLVQAGSLLRANGGFLVMEIESVLANPNVWEALKRALQNKLLYIEDAAVSMGFSAASLRPEPFPLNVKVILIGAYETFHMVQGADPKFSKIFKVRADFDHETERTPEALEQYARFIAGVSRQENLLPFTRKGVAAVVEYGEKNIAHQKKLSLRFGPIVDIIKEADYWARRENLKQVDGANVDQAFEAYRDRISLYEDKIHEQYADNTIFIDVGDSEVGQVNALAVYQIGEFAFGRPSRITAETFMGKPGVINIEREAKLSGNTHDKGVLILSGYLGRTFARKYPLSLSISVTFEQSYGGIDGDSASSTELYAILSSLAEVPINQGLAVTGSVNQKGQVQAIGGANQKIEGFFDVCRAKGLNGRQGVLIPETNTKHLMLKKSVVEAVANGQFNIYPVTTITEGIEILTGLPAGKPDDQGQYPADSLYGRVAQQLERYFKQSQKQRNDH
jgi:lon-related putative ATP-dependent protease